MAVAKTSPKANHRGIRAEISVTSRSSVTVLVLALAVGAWADSKPAAQAQRQPMSRETRFYVIRGLQSEIAFARKPFPMGTKGLTLRENGMVTPSEGDLEKAIAVLGPAVRPGDRVRITDVRIAKDYILFEVNGGPKKKKKWYQHIQVGVSGAPVATGPQQEPPDNPRGTLLILAFKDYVPEITPDQLKEMLHPVLDFSSKSATEAYLDTIPPKAKEAIKNHQVLVGMDQEMVVYAKGRPSKKVRENDSEGKPYEEWIYGEPPQDVEFVRFSGPEVVQVKIMQVDGDKIVRTEKEIDLKDLREAEARKKEQEQLAKPQPVANRPTLRRPGEEDESPTRKTAPSAPEPSDPNQRDPTLGPPREQPPTPVPSPPPSSPVPPGQGDPTSHP